MVAGNLLAALIDNALHYRLPTATGLPCVPAANRIDVDASGAITGLA